MESHFCSGTRNGAYFFIARRHAHFDGDFLEWLLERAVGLLSNVALAAAFSIEQVPPVHAPRSTLCRIHKAFAERQTPRGDLRDRRFAGRNSCVGERASGA